MKVTLDKTAIAVGSGDLEVFATPMMVALMENAAMKVAAQYCGEGETTVGVKVEIVHTRATLIGGNVEANAVLREVEGRKLIFDVKATDDKGEIGSGVHERFIVNKEKFLSKL